VSNEIATVQRETSRHEDACSSINADEAEDGVVVREDAISACEKPR
jgi:hypothetical protein